MAAIGLADEGLSGLGLEWRIQRSNDIVDGRGCLLGVDRPAQV